MSHAASPGDSPRRTSAPPDLDALLNSLKAEPRTGEQPGDIANQPTGDLTSRRVQALIRAFDVLHKQVSTIASQSAAIGGLAEEQARTAKAIAGLQRNSRSLRAVIIQLLQQSSLNGGQALPPLQVKLVVGHLVEQYQQAEQDAAALNQWAMLFVGIAVGTGVGAGVSAVGQPLLLIIVLSTTAIMSLLVALIFGGLARGSRARAAGARRAMDESTLLRTIATNAPPEPPH